MTEEGSPDVLEITEDERLLQVEPTRDDVACVLSCKLGHLIKLELVLEKILLVIYSSSIASAVGLHNCTSMKRYL